MFQSYIAYRKNGETSSILREIGRAAHAQKNLKEALKYYNLAVSYAPFHHDKELPELFETLAERSEILLQARGGEEALRDVNFLLGLLTGIDSNMWMSMIMVIVV